MARVPVKTKTKRRSPTQLQRRRVRKKTRPGYQACEVVAKPSLRLAGDDPDVDRVFMLCSHRHPTQDAAFACARRHFLS